ncbi:MAG TPA: phosphodiester glycosidase family protein [Puia sp.]|nr:phosphodiester glycosidase family protein [Puia sp.]
MMMKKGYLYFLFLMVFGVQAMAQKKAAHDPDDSIVVEKSKTGDAGNAAPLRWQQVDGEYGPLPASVHVYRTQDSLAGRPEVAYYFSAPVGDRSLHFTAQVGYGKRYTPAQYYAQEGHPLLVINTSFFSFATNANRNLVIRDGKMLAADQTSFREKKDSLYHYRALSALGITAGRKADVAWTFTVPSQALPYALEDDPVEARGADSIPSLAAMPHAHWRRWKMQTAVGGGPMLVHNGHIRVTCDEEGLFLRGKRDMHPRSAIGYTRDGRIIVLAVQGRTPGVAAGVTLGQEAKILLDLGCYGAINLDGGGSTCMLVNGKETIHPSDKGGERPIPAVFLITTVR